MRPAHDRREIPGNAAAVAGLELLPEPRGEGLPERFGDEDEVGRDAGLSGIEPLRRNDPRDGQVQVDGLVEETGALAPQFEHDRSEVPGRGFAVKPPDALAAGVEKEVEGEIRGGRPRFPVLP